MSLSTPPGKGMAKAKRAKRGSTTRVARVCLDTAAEKNLATIQDFVERTIGERPSLSLAMRQALFIFATQAKSKRRG
jgi:hypothetical protein